MLYPHTLLKVMWNNQLVSIFRPFAKEFCECKQVYKMVKIWRSNIISAWFNPLGDSVSSFWIQKTWLHFNRNFKVSVSVVISCSINVNFAWRSNECPGFLKCKLAVIDFGLFTSFLWLLSLMLKDVSNFPTYWALHNAYSIKWMMNLLVQFNLWNIVYSCCV